MIVTTAGRPRVYASTADAAGLSLLGSSLHGSRRAWQFPDADAASWKPHGSGINGLAKATSALEECQQVGVER